MFGVAIFQGVTEDRRRNVGVAYEYVLNAVFVRLIMYHTDNKKLCSNKMIIRWGGYYD